MKFELVAFTQLGDFYSNLSKDEARKNAIHGYDEFFKTKESPVATDDFIDLDLHVYYSPESIIKGVELFYPNQLFYKDINLLGVEVKELLTCLLLNKIEYSIEFGDIEMPQIGVSLGCSEDEDSLVEITTSAYVSFEK
jgi:hypothetical protein